MVEPQNDSGDRSKMGEIEAYLQAYLETGYFMGSVLVGLGGEVLFSKGYGMANLEHNIPNILQTKFRLGSVTKQFTATAILKLQEQNLLDINNSIATYLPDYPCGEQITVHHLLNHTAGIPNYTNFDDFSTKKKLEIKLEDLIASFKYLPLEFTPGEMFSYSNSGYLVLSKIIETVSNQSYADYLQQYIFKPLGMKDSGYDCHETILLNRAAGYIFSGEEYQNADFLDMSFPSGAGALYSTVDDIYTWERSLYTDAILNQSSRDTMFASTIKVPTDENELAYYGYGWFIDTQHNRRRISHGGGIDGFRTQFDRYPNEQIAIAILSNLQTSPAGKIGRDLAAILWGESYELPQKRKAIEIDPTIYETYVGTYKFEPSSSLPPSVSDLIFTVTTKNRRIFTQLTGQEVVEIFPESPTKFFLKFVDAQLTFVTNKENKVSQVILHQNRKDTVLNRIN
ncbi:Serine hydrolase [Hyella patelloides LEGE 07179]|uniref:Serine hydrolase n=1 Tax=Hyella patelloides LEGE 07179 TaxID=945734 RepID=A0A563VZG0_9CYAN|nr:serine hydrolase [Hyella patelloides]VEP16852.1 Serine hydrolase [Hyella patelloides LEGE 07179]